MFAFNFVVLFSVLGVYTVSTGLEPLSRGSTSPDILRDAINRIFSMLKLRTNRNTKLKEYLSIHKYFASVTSRENQNRKEVTNLITLNNIDNGTTNFTSAITEALNERNTQEDVNATSNDYEVNILINNFLTTLSDLKETFLINNSYKSINSEILQHFKLRNVNQNNSVYNEVDSNENATDETEFWVPTVETRRVYRGETTKIKYFPFVASVQIFNQFTCAGSIIKSDLVITAASCLQLAHNNRFYRENPAFLSVRVGSTFYNGGGENIPVMEVYFYPTYTPKTLRDNVAIMRLLRALNFKKRYIKKIAIDENPTALPLNTDGITIIGWGAKTTSNKVHNPWTNRISFDVLDIYPLEDCQDIYTKTYVTRKHFCAGFLSKGGGACNRDVGAPGLVRGILMGVVSFASPSCGAADAPTVFTKLGHYAKWIDEIMSQDPPNYLARTTTRLPYTHTILATTSKDSRDFKIEPISKKNVKRYHEIESLLSDQKVFKEFLETVFDSKEVEKYENKLSGFLEKKEQEQKEEEREGIDRNDIPHKDLTRAGNNTEDLSEVFEKSEEPDVPEKSVTNMGKVDADFVVSDQSGSDSLSSTSEEKRDKTVAVKYYDTKKAVITTSEKPQKTEVETGEGLNIEDIVREGHNLEDDVGNVENILKGDTIGIDEDLDKEVDQLIKNFDIEKINSSDLVGNFDVNKEIDDTKILALLHEDGNENKDDTDETILTLLYLPETERKAADLKVKGDQGSDEDEGMSIDLGTGNDTLRTSNVTNERKDFMSKDEMYDILVDAIKS